LDPENAIHLGDGAYATFDGYGVMLTANHHDPAQATDKVYLEPFAIKKLQEWWEAQRQ